MHLSQFSTNFKLRIIQENRINKNQIPDVDHVFGPIAQFWTKISSKFEQFDEKHDQYLGFDFLLIRISRKILNLKLVEN